MTTATPVKATTTIWTCGCGRRIPVGPDTLAYLKSGEVSVCGCGTSKGAAS